VCKGDAEDAATTPTVAAISYTCCTTVLFHETTLPTTMKAGSAEV